MITQEMHTFRTNVKYKVESLDILFADGSKESIEPGMVTHLYLEKDYETTYFPILNISVVMNDIVFNRINKENETVKFRLKVNKMIYDTNGGYLKYELFCNELFICFLNKEVVVMDEESVEDKKRIEKDDNPTNRANNRNFYLFKEEVVKCKEQLNLSVESSSLTDLVLYLFGVCGIQKLLMSKLDNTSMISNVLIPTGNLIECIKYLDNIKGFYKKGLQLFFDIDTAYFIDINSKCTAWRKNEVRMTHMHISNQKNQDSQLTGVFVDVDRKSSHVFSNTNRIKINNSNLLNDQINGNKITVVNNKNNSVDKVHGDYTQVGKPNGQVLVTTEDNKYTVDSIKYRMNENECIISLAFLGVDISVFDPNKEFLLTYEDSKLNLKYGGAYRISKLVAALKKDGEELVGDINTVFKKQ